MSESIETVCLRDQFIKHSIKTEELRKLIRQRVFDITKQWFRVTRVDKSIELSSESMNVGINLKTLNKLKETFEAESISTHPSYSQTLKICIEF